MNCAQHDRIPLTKILTLALALHLLPSAALGALDPPHAGQNAVGCLSCHQMTSTYPKLLPPLDHTAQDIDDTIANNSCWSCHNDVTAPYVQTHSSLQADNGYGNWSVECWVCHNQHMQEQNRYSGSTYGMYIRRSVNLANITGLTKTGTKAVVFKGQTGANSFADGDPIYNGICEVCHTQTRHFQNDGSSDDQLHGNRQGTNCTEKCHTHANGFIHGGGANCTECHGHEDGYGGAPSGTYFGSTQSHSTHTETDNDLNGPRPILACNACHNTTSFPLFRSKADANAKLTLAATDICNDCHSEGGAYDGLNDPAVGAKKNWRSGIYNGAMLANGKERWCVTCHDLGTSLIGGRQAPDVAGDDINYGFYRSGHGQAVQECSACHDLSTAHIDGNQTYAAPATPSQYRLAYRLVEVSGKSPFNITYYQPNPCIYNQSPADFELCYKCHSEQQLLNDTRTTGYLSCTTNPYDNGGAITTYFKDGINGKNIHADHLIGVSGWQFISGTPLPKWDSDGNGTLDNAVSCSTCHNPHGASRPDGATPTKKMTVTDLDIQWGNDALGDFGQVGPQGNLANVCFGACHASNGGKYYRPHPAPPLNSISVTDNTPADPVAAGDGYTNNASVTVTFSLGSMTAPTQMRIAENRDYTANSTDWLPYTSPYTYTLSAGEGSKTVFAQIKDGSDATSDIKGYRIILDTIDPAVDAATVTAPNGAENWLQDTTHGITWTPAKINDTNLKGSPITLNLNYSYAGSNYSILVATSEANDGTYSWTVSPVESTTARIQMTATDKAGNQGSDESNADFTIQPVGPAVLNSITVSDDNSMDPADAEAGYTNNPSVLVSLSVSNNPTHMVCAQNAAFSVNPQPSALLVDGWAPFAASFTYPLAGADGNHTIYCKVKNGLGESGDKNFTITLDRTAPDLPVLTSPAGGELWLRNTDQTLSWDTGSISDPAPGSLKASPVTLAYSQDYGATYPNIIAAGITNSGSYLWRTPISASHSTKVRLTANDRAGNQSSDANTVFITPPSNYIVTNTNDSGNGSLRWAIANRIAAFAGGYIWFNIPNTDPGFSSGVAVISLTSALPVLSQSGIIIEGTSQRDLQGDTNANGPEIRIKGPAGLTGIDITAADVQVKEVQLTNWSTGIRSNAANTVLLNSYVGFSADSAGYDGNQKNNTNIVLNTSASGATIGNASGGGNYVSCAAGGNGISDSGTGNTIAGNRIGLLPNGANCSNGGFGSSGMYLSSDNDIILDNVICGSEAGIHLAGTATGNTIRGNTFGVWYDGSWHDCSDQSEAILVWSPNAENNTIGGPNRATGDNDLNDSNVIDPGTYGIRYRGKASGYDFIYGNYIGTNTNTSQSFPGTYGIDTSSSTNIMIGGGGTGRSGNVIANMTGYGVFVSSAEAKYITISKNSFYNNDDNVDDDAIYLAPGTPGGNEGITRPVIAFANTNVVTVNNVASGDTVEVYRSDGTGTFGEGKTYINYGVASGTSVTVDISSAALSDGDWVTATRTNSSGSTSAFSLNVQPPWP